jgi:hypothetical protein
MGAEESPRHRGRWQRAGLAMALAISTGCNESSPTEPAADPQPLALHLLVQGTAESVEADGSTVSCELDLYIDLEGPPHDRGDALEYHGFMGGSVQRTVLDVHGDGISLWPDVFGEVIVRSFVTGEMDIVTPINATAEGRFWRQLYRLEGRLSGPGTAAGDWRCAPFDLTEGWVDTRYTADGTWTLHP